MIPVKEKTINLIDGNDLAEELRRRYGIRATFFPFYPALTGESKMMLWETDLDWLLGDEEEERLRNIVAEEARAGRVNMDTFMCLLALDGVLEWKTYTVYFAW